MQRLRVCVNVLGVYSYMHVCVYVCVLACVRTSTPAGRSRDETDKVIGSNEIQTQQSKSLSCSVSLSLFIQIHLFFSLSVSLFLSPSHVHVRLFEVSETSGLSEF